MLTQPGGGVEASRFDGFPDEFADLAAAFFRLFQPTAPGVTPHHVAELPAVPDIAAVTDGACEALR